MRSDPRIFSADDPIALLGAFKTHIPLYSLRAAAGKFGSNEAVEPEGWIESPPGVQPGPGHFAARIEGKSMEPAIPDGSIGIFRADPQGSRQGKTVLAQWRGPADPETGGSYAVKIYESKKSYSPEGEWRHDLVRLKPTNPDYPILDFTMEDGEFLKVLAELVGVVPPNPPER
jgi:phage repressor protein C with HTH and peptisase S24 domain